MRVVGGDAGLAAAAGGGAAAAGGGAAEALSTIAAQNVAERASWRRQQRPNSTLVSQRRAGPPPVLAGRLPIFLARRVEQGCSTRQVLVRAPPISPPWAPRRRRALYPGQGQPLAVSPCRAPLPVALRRAWARRAAARPLEPRRRAWRPARPRRARLVSTPARSSIHGGRGRGWRARSARRRHARNVWRARIAQRRDRSRRDRDRSGGRCDTCRRQWFQSWQRRQFRQELRRACAFRRRAARRWR